MYDSCTHLASASALSINECSFGEHHSTKREKNECFWVHDLHSRSMSDALATSGTRTDIGLTRCKFEDDGEAFLGALAAREDPQTGLAYLTTEPSKTKSTLLERRLMETVKTAKEIAFFLKRLKKKKR
jgi:hypothetical protein